jgi:S1-C subfamily serine protease
VKLKLKAVGAALSLSFFILAGSILAPQLHNSYLRYEVGESTVRVMVSERGGGSGFAVEGASGQNYIATNKHVCEGAEKGWVKIKSDSGLEAWKRIVYIDNKHDVCLVEGDKRLSPLELSKSPSKGDFHYIVGHPGLRQLTVSQGEYIGFDVVKLLDNVKNKNQCKGEIYELNPMEQFFFGREWVCIRGYLSYASTAVAYGGNSGSPVVNKYGNVIGILFAGDREQERSSFIVPGYELQRVLNKF